jgi:hypothetical protein
MERELDNNNKVVPNPADSGIVNLLISLHTFPLESEEDLSERRKQVIEIMKQQQEEQTIQSKIK